MKRILTILALTSLSPVSLADDIHESHARLGETVSQYVNYRVNPIECLEMNNAYGYYWSSNEELVVCQQGMGKPDVMMPWSSADYNTLRHEAQHLIQDCIEGEVGDSKSRPYLSDQDDYDRFVELSLDAETVERIREVYSDKSNDDIIMEIEAFAVAESIDADTISSTINSVCSNASSS